MTRTRVAIAVFLAACGTDVRPQKVPTIEWPAGHDVVDTSTGQKGVFLTEQEYQRIWDYVVDLETVIDSR